jgi:uncharacterized protein (DUF1330 family)
MSCYFIAQIKIKDEKEYGKYLEASSEVFCKYGGEYLAVDDKPVVLEGGWDYTRTVIIRFPDEKEFRNWYESDEYRKILKYRLSAANCDSILVKGLE